MLGLHNTIGYSLFGIEDLWNARRYDSMRFEEKDALRIDWEWDHCDEGTITYIGKAYQIIAEIWDVYLEKQQECIGFARRNGYERGAVIPLKRFDVLLKYPEKEETKAGSAGILIPEGEDGFYLIGCNADISVCAKIGEEETAELLGVWEGEFKGGHFVEGRKLNGDELHAQCRLGDIPSVIKVEVGIV